MTLVHKQKREINISHDCKEELNHYGRGFEPQERHCVVFLSKNIYPSLVLVQPRKTRSFRKVVDGMLRIKSNKNYCGSASNLSSCIV